MSQGARRMLVTQYLLTFALRVIIERSIDYVQNCSWQF